MHPRAEAIPPRVFPIGGLLLLLAGSIGASYWLVPRQDELVERLFKDKHYERIAALLRSEIGDGAGADTSKLRRLTAEQLAALSQLLRLTPREQLRAVFSGSRPPAYDVFVHGIVLAAVRYVDVVPPKEAWEMIGANLGRIPADRQIELAVLLAHNALAENQPQLSAEILHHVAALPGAPWTVARDMALSYRWSGGAREGAQALRLWLRKNCEGLDMENLRTLRDLSRAMALESGQPGLALDLLLEELAAIPAGGLLTEAQMNEALDLAGQSGRTRDLVPLLQRYVAQLPESRLSWQDLRARASQPEHAADCARYRKWEGLVAQYCDWNSEFDAAFDHRYRLAAMGDLPSLDRCVALYDFLGRNAEMADLLLATHPVREREGMHLVLARLLAEEGDDEGALDLFDSWLARHPDDRDATYDHACLLEDMGDEDAALQAFAKMLRRFPEDVPCVKKLAEAYIRSARYAEALELYAGLKAEAHDPHTLESYSLLAESLDRHEDLCRALRLQIQASSHPTVEQFADLAEASAYLPDLDAPIRVLNEGLKALPDSAALRVSLATAYLKRDQPDEAVAAITAAPALRNQYDAVRLLLGVASQVVDPTKILGFIGRDVTTRFEFAVDARLDLAVLYHLCGLQVEAEKMLSSVPETAENLLLIASARYETGEYEKAAQLVTKRLQENPHGAASDWIFLGELYELLGRTEDAQKAYNYSLALLTAELGDTAYSPPPTSPAANPVATGSP